MITQLISHINRNLRDKKTGVKSLADFNFTLGEVVVVSELPYDSHRCPFV